MARQYYRKCEFGCLYGHGVLERKFDWNNFAHKSKILAK